uniref:Uncharacterized protein LOC100180089 n=1 Tax=Phallusia mammillata TaxID=59560 RepID=A0A6F9DHT5_9ASCI|nr:uncharacterized protein LOC100180089 [Phallusia mammillata]
MCSRKIFGSVFLVLTVYLSVSIRLLKRAGTFRPYSATETITIYLEDVNNIQTRSKCQLKIYNQPDENPIIKLNPHKFILPVLYNGPTNQLIGLRDTVYLAILLNRTVIIPEFHKHLTDTSGQFQAVDGSLRVDIPALSALVSVIPHSAILDHCKNHFDVAFLGQPLTQKHFQVNRASLQHYNVTLSRGKKGQRFNTLLNPRDQTLKMKPLDLRDYYKTDAKCAMLYYAYRSVDAKETPEMLLKAKEMNLTDINTSQLPKMDKNLLYSLVATHVHTPEFISNIADEFAREVIGTNQYIAVHWRFDPLDWQRKCRRETTSPIDAMCKQVDNVTGADIVNAALKHNEYVLKSSTRPVIYFATPIYRKDLLLSLQSHIRDINQRKGLGVRLYTGLDLQEQLNKYSVCSELNGNVEDVLASVEMEICAKAKSFMFSKHSSWSAEVLNHRVGHEFANFDRDILKASVEFRKSVLSLK